MPRRRMPSGQRRAQLASKAKGAFIEGGYRGTTTKDVAEAAGVSEALITKHFGTKEELFRHSMIEPLLEMLNEAVKSPMPTGVGIGERYSGLYDFYYGWAKIVHEHGALLWAVLRETQNFPEIATTIAVMFKRHVREVAEVLTTSLEREQFRDFDVEIATYLGLGAATIAGMVGDDPENFVRETVELMFRGMLTPEGRRALDVAVPPLGAKDEEKS